MNVVLVTVDCLRQDRCGIYGHHRDTTPTLDDLGRQGFVFDNAYATGPGTTESFPGILAGRLSRDCVVANNLYQKRIPDGKPTIASHMCDAGWATAAVITNPRIGSHVASDRGFETFQNLRTTPDESSETNSISSSLLPNLSVGSRLYQLRERMREFDSVPLRYELPFLAFRSYQYLAGWPSVRGERVVDEFLDTLDGLSSPFFAWTHLMDVHGPIHPQTVIDGGLADGGLLTQFRSHAKRVSNVHDPQLEARYDSAVRYVDDQLARIVGWLKTNGMWEETALIVTADHGDALYDRGVYSHLPHYMYDELLNVPLTVRVPGQEGYRVDRPFSLGWTHQLISDICDLDAMTAPMSSDAKNLLSPSDAGDDILLADSISPHGHSVAAWNGGQKLIRHTGDICATSSTDPKIALPGIHRLSRDPMERDPVDENVPVLERAVDTVTVHDLDSIYSRADQTNLDRTTKDRLRQLGYAE